MKTNKVYTFNTVSKKVRNELLERYIMMTESEGAKEIYYNEAKDYWMTGNGEGGAVLFDKDGNEIEE